ncbi:MAG: phosphoenolpyruvate kinase [Acidobacteriia bacterium]|nr:phosphoenolpyruvate kinase [Terriglobia bacterium]
MGDLALKFLHEYAPDHVTLAETCAIPPPLAHLVYTRILEKLQREPVEALHIDFEDGYGIRPDAEEDEAARTVAARLAEGRDRHSLPAFIGIRIKSFTDESKPRALRTLHLVLDNLHPLPENFTVALPKITAPGQAAECAAILDEYGVKRLEIMIETPQSLFLIPQLVDESRGLLTTAHFGAYDYTAALGIAAAHQDMLHPACDFARSMMQAQLASTGVHVSDGATNILPLPPNVHRGWSIHARHIRHSLECGFYQSWDLHPAQLVSRYAAVYSFFLEGLDASSERLKNFIARAAQATQVGGVFDDAATGQGLLNYFLRAVNCGAIPESGIPALTGLSLDELRSASFATILKGRSHV